MPVLVVDYFDQPGEGVAVEGAEQERTDRVGIGLAPARGETVGGGVHHLPVLAEFALQAGGEPEPVNCVLRVGLVVLEQCTDAGRVAVICDRLPERVVGVGVPGLEVRTEFAGKVQILRRQVGGGRSGTDFQQRLRDPDVAVHEQDANFHSSLHRPVSHRGSLPRQPRRMEPRLTSRALERVESSRVESLALGSGEAACSSSVRVQRRATACIEWRSCSSVSEHDLAFDAVQRPQQSDLRGVDTNTRPMWAIAVLPLAGVPVGLIPSSSNGFAPDASPTGAVLNGLTVALTIGLVVVGVLLAVADRRVLRQRGIFRPMHPAWEILDPVYVIGRAVVVRRRVRGSLTPLWVWIATSIVATAIGSIPR